MYFNNVACNFNPHQLIPVIQKYNALCVLDLDFELLNVNATIPLRYTYNIVISLFPFHAVLNCMSKKSPKLRIVCDYHSSP